MKNTLVDSSVIIDLFTKDEVWFSRSSSALREAMNSSVVVINPIIYAEVSNGYTKIEDLDEKLPGDLYRRDNLPYAAAFIAARAFVKYRRQGGSRTAPMPDFYIGAHAEVARFRLLTRDPRRIRRYFPTVEVITP